LECFISNCNEIATEIINDATQNPEKYNGKMLCKQHFNDRKYMKECDIFD